MLQKLKELHSEIAERLTQLDLLVSKDQPDIEKVMSVRLALTRASRARTRLLETEVYPRLLAALTSRDADSVRALQQQGKADLAVSSSHIVRWSHRTITAEWDQYRKASDAVRPAMRERIKAEQDLLYPILARLPT